jgi:hypothetical protein
LASFEAGQLGDERLEIEQRLQPALRDLRLVRRVGGVPAGIFEDGALDDRRRMRVAVTKPDEIPENLVLARDRPEVGERGAFAERGRQLQRPAPNLRRHRGRDERIERRLAERLEHRGGFAGIVAEVTAGERIGGSQEVAERRHGRRPR